MITGNVRTFDFRFGDEFVSFLQIAGKASVTINTEVASIDDENEDIEEVRFNYQDSLSRYKRRLDDAMYKASDSLKGMLDQIYEKLDKLSFLGHFIVEIDSCKKYLTRSPEGTYRHKLFTIFNVYRDAPPSKIQITEDDFAEHYYWMRHYLEKMSSYLQILKTSIEVTAQSEIKPPASMSADPNGSTEGRPFEFFDFLFNRNGLGRLRAEFLPTEESPAYDTYSWDPVAEVVTYLEQDGDTGEWEEIKVSFQDRLTKRMYNEYLISKSLIDGRISRCATKSEAQFYVERCIVHLKYFLIQIPKHKESKKYNFLEKFARGLIIYFYERYESFCGTRDKVVTEVFKATKAAQQQLPQDKVVKRIGAPGVKVFTLQGMTTEAFALILHLHLKQICLEEDLSVEQLGKAFSGQFFDQPLRIRWICKSKNSHVNKRALFYLFNQLAKAGLIEEEGTNSEFIKTLNFIFVDGDGDQLRHLNVSNAESGKPSKGTEPYKPAIDQAVAALLKEKK